MVINLTQRKKGRLGAYSQRKISNRRQFSKWVFKWPVWRKVWGLQRVCLETRHKSTPRISSIKDSQQQEVYDLRHGKFSTVGNYLCCVKSACPHEEPLWPKHCVSTGGATCCVPARQAGSCCGAMPTAAAASHTAPGTRFLWEMCFHSWRTNLTLNTFTPEFSTLQRCNLSRVCSEVVSLSCPIWRAEV